MVRLQQASFLNGQVLGEVNVKRAGPGPPLAVKLAVGRLLPLEDGAWGAPAFARKAFAVRRFGLEGAAPPSCAAASARVRGIFFGSYPLPRCAVAAAKAPVVASAAALRRPSAAGSSANLSDEDPGAWDVA